MGAVGSAPKKDRRAPVFLVFDSGLGGLSVLKPLHDTCKGARFIYVADNAAFPYGKLSEGALERRVLDVFDRLIDQNAPHMAVIACHTASTLVLSALRAKFEIPFVGTVPAIRVAARVSKSRMIGVLATPGTARRDYTGDLITQFAGDCQVVLCGSDRLAQAAEAKLAGISPDMAMLKREIAPVFTEANGVQTDVVVLACTHYPFLRDELEKAAPWPVTFIDPADAIADRAAAVLKELAVQGNGQDDIRHVAISTKRYADEARIKAVLAGFGIADSRILAMAL
jgi:glutamate racemase